MENRIITLNLKTQKTLTKEKYYQKSYLLYLTNMNRLTLFDLNDSYFEQALNNYLSTWEKDLSDKRMKYLEQNIHSKTNNKVFIKSYVQLKKIVNSFKSNKDNLIANCLDNLQEFQIRDNVIVNVTYEGMNI